MKCPHVKNYIKRNIWNSLKFPSENYLLSQEWRKHKFQLERTLGVDRSTCSEDEKIALGADLVDTVNMTLSDIRGKVAESIKVQMYSK